MASSSPSQDGAHAPVAAPVSEDGDTSAAVETFGKLDGPLPDTVRKIVSPEGVEVYLLGTAHISKASVDDAQMLVSKLRPHCVFLELCKRRESILNLRVGALQPPPELTMASLLDQLKSGGGAAELMNLVVASYCDGMAESLGIEITPGTEFAAAAQEAFKYGGLVILGDRDVNVTLWRAWRALTVWDRIRLLYYLLFEKLEDMTADDLERLKDSDMITEAITELTKEMPRLVEPLIYERDRFLTYQLRDACSRIAKLSPPPSALQLDMPFTPKTLVAVVGMGHVAGTCGRQGASLRFGSAARWPLPHMHLFAPPRHVGADGRSLFGCRDARDVGHAL